MRKVRNRRLRRVVQVLFFLCFLVLLYFTTQDFLLGPIPTDIFLRFSPLIALCTMLAHRAIVPTVVIPALITVALTLLLGRVFCGWFCPMGTAIDLAEKLFFRKRRYPRPEQDKLDRLRAIKYVLLFVVIFSALLSYQPLLWLDPISFVHRTFIVAVYGPADHLYEDARGAAYGWLLRRGVRISEPREGVVYRLNLLILAMFVVVVGLSAVQKRFWCRNLCPLGALLALLSWRPLLQRRVSAECTSCLRCERDCKMGCIYDNGRAYRARECIVCYNCEPICPEGAVSFPFAGAREEGFDSAHQITRRRIAGAAVASVLWFFAMRTSVGTPEGKPGEGSIREERTKHPRRIRPPGALPERLFLQLCARCGECIKVCPSNGLQPALFEAGLEGMFTPILIPRVGECVEKCDACGQVCPTGAIQNFTYEMKRDKLIIGKATIDRSLCRPWNRTGKCQICEEHCSYKAITSEMSEWGMLVPYVHKDKCTGCGMCEKVCPVTPTAAITVYAREDKRPVLKQNLGLLSAFVERRTRTGAK